jgi:leucyl-tRNA synthetase
VNPDEIIHEYGADTLRMYEMFMGPFDQAVAWSTKGVQGVKRFLDRFVRLGESLKEGVLLSKENETLLHQTVKKVGEDIESFKFNTAVSSLMILLNALEKEEGVAREVYRTTVLLIAPFAPHLAEELWEMYGFKEGDRSIHEEKWPSYDVEKLTLDTVVYAVQVNGKLRGELEAKRDENEEILKKRFKIKRNL